MKTQISSTKSERYHILFHKSKESLALTAQEYIEDLEKLRVEYQRKASSEIDIHKSYAYNKIAEGINKCVQKANIKK